MDMADSPLIIMVDNGSPLRASVSFSLRAEGYSVLECSSETGLVDLMSQVRGLIGQPVGGSEAGADDSQGQSWQSLRLFQRAIAASRCGIWICDAHEAHLPVIHVNPAFELITGLAAAQVPAEFVVSTNLIL